ncbi:hypothetical protein [Mesorhizobium sp. M0185]
MPAQSISPSKPRALLAGKIDAKAGADLFNASLQDLKSKLD